MLDQASKRHNCMVSCTGLHADIRKEDTEVKESLGQIAKGGLFLKVFPQYLQTKMMIFQPWPLFMMNGMKKIRFGVC